MQIARQNGIRGNDYFFRKAVCVFLAAALLFDPQFLPPVLASGHPVSDPAVRIMPGRLSEVRVPGEIGSIQEVSEGEGEQAVILIQDAHAVPDAQRNIRKLIGHFQAGYGVDLIALEGTASRLDPAIFRSFPDKKILETVFEQYRNAGELAGAVDAAVFGPDGADYRGVEDWRLYEEGLGFYIRAVQGRDIVNARLGPLRKEISEIKKQIYSPELLKLDQDLENFYANALGLPALLLKLASYREPAAGSPLALLLEECRREAKGGRNLDAEVRDLAGKVKSFLEMSRAAGLKNTLAEFNAKDQAFRTSQLAPEAFAAYLQDAAAANGLPFQGSAGLLHAVGNQKKMRDIEGTALAGDLEQYARAVKESLFRNEDQKRIDREARRLRLLEKLSALELGRGEWEELKRGMENGEWGMGNGGWETGDGGRGMGGGEWGGKEGIGVSVDRNIGDTREAFPGTAVFSPLRRHADTPMRDISYLSPLSPDFEAHIAFYENAGKREQALFENLGALMKSRGKQTAVFVAGGFHAQGFMRHLKSRGISCLLVTPKISSVPDGTNYRACMKGEVSWKSYFEAEHGRVDLYKAFVRCTRDRLLMGVGGWGMGYGKRGMGEGEWGKGDGVRGGAREVRSKKQEVRGKREIQQESNLTSYLLPPTSRLRLKQWRDEIIRDLAGRGEIEKARDYTSFLDETGLPAAGQGRFERFATNARRFLEGVRRLDELHQLNEPSVLGLLKAAAMTPAVLLPGGSLDARLLGFSSSPLPQVRRPVPSRSEIRDEIKADAGQKRLARLGRSILSRFELEPFDLDRLADAYLKSQSKYWVNGDVKARLAFGRLIGKKTGLRLSREPKAVGVLLKQILTAMPRTPDVKVFIRKVIEQASVTPKNYGIVIDQKLAFGRWLPSDLVPLLESGDGKIRVAVVTYQNREYQEAIDRVNRLLPEGKKIVALDWPFAAVPALREKDPNIHLVYATSNPDEVTTLGHYYNAFFILPARSETRKGAGGEARNAAEDFRRELEAKKEIRDRLEFLISNLLVEGQQIDFRAVRPEWLRDPPRAAALRFAFQSKIELFKYLTGKEDAAVRAMMKDIARQKDGQEKGPFTAAVEEILNSKWREWHRLTSLAELKISAQYGKLYYPALGAHWSDKGDFPVDEDIRDTTLNFHPLGSSRDVILVARVPAFLNKLDYGKLVELLNLGDETLPDGFLENPAIRADALGGLRLAQQLNGLAVLELSFIDFERTRILSGKLLRAENKKPNEAKAGIRAMEQALESVERAARSETRTETKIPLQLPGHWIPGKKVGHIILLTDFDGVYRLNGDEGVDPGLKRLLARLVGTGHVSIGFISGSPAFRQPGITGEWFGDHEPLPAALSDFLHPGLPSIENVRVFGAQGGQVFDIKTQQHRYVFAPYSSQETAEVLKGLLTSFLTMFQATAKDANQRRAAASLARLKDFQPPVRPDTVPREILGWFQPWLEEFEKFGLPLLHLKYRGTEIELYMNDAEAEKAGFDMRPAVPIFRDYAGRHPLLKLIPEEGRQIFFGRNFMKMTRASKKGTAKIFREQVREWLEAQRRLAPDEQVLVVGLGDGFVDLPMYGEADVSYHLGRETIVGQTDLKNTWVVRDGKGSDRAHLAGTRMILENLLDVLGKPLADFKLYQVRGSEGAWLWVPLGARSEARSAMSLENAAHLSQIQNWASPEERLQSVRALAAGAKSANGHDAQLLALTNDAESELSHPHNSSRRFVEWLAPRPDRVGAIENPWGRIFLHMETAIVPAMFLAWAASQRKVSGSALEAAFAEQLAVPILRGLVEAGQDYNVYMSVPHARDHLMYRLLAAANFGFNPARLHRDLLDWTPAPASKNPAGRSEARDSDWADKNAVVTGIGHIGSGLLDRLLAQAKSVTTLFIGPGEYEPFAGYDFENRGKLAAPLYGRLPDKQIQRELLKHDVVFHLAGRASARPFPGEESLAAEDLLALALLDNAVPLALFVELARSSEKKPRLVFTSSIQVYSLMKNWQALGRPLKEDDLKLEEGLEAWVSGLKSFLLTDVAGNFLDRQTAEKQIRAYLAEHELPHPDAYRSQWYALSKIVGERILEDYPNSVSLRLAAVYGPGGFDVHRENVLTDWPLERWVQEAMTGTKKIEYPPSVVKPHIHADDAVNAILRAGTADLQGHRVLNVGPPEVVRTDDIIRSIIRETGASPDRFVKNPQASGNTPRPGLDIGLMDTLLGIHPADFLRLPDGIRRQAALYKPGAVFPKTWASRYQNQSRSEARGDLNKERVQTILAGTVSETPQSGYERVLTGWNETAVSPEVYLWVDKARAADYKTELLEFARGLLLTIVRKNFAVSFQTGISFLYPQPHDISPLLKLGLNFEQTRKFVVLGQALGLWQGSQDHSFTAVNFSQTLINEARSQVRPDLRRIESEGTAPETLKPLPGNPFEQAVAKLREAVELKSPVSVRVEKTGREENGNVRGLHVKFVHAGISVSGFAYFSKPLSVAQARDFAGKTVTAVVQRVSPYESTKFYADLPATGAARSEMRSKKVPKTGAENIRFIFGRMPEEAAGEWVEVEEFLQDIVKTLRLNLKGNRDVHVASSKNMADSTKDGVFRMTLKDRQGNRLDSFVLYRLSEGYVVDAYLLAQEYLDRHPDFDVFPKIAGPLYDRNTRGITWFAVEDAGSPATAQDRGIETRAYRKMQRAGFQLRKDEMFRRGTVVVKTAGGKRVAKIVDLDTLEKIRNRSEARAKQPGDTGQGRSFSEGMKTINRSLAELWAGVETWAGAQKTGQGPDLFAGLLARKERISALIEEADKNLAEKADRQVVELLFAKNSLRHAGLALKLAQFLADGAGSIDEIAKGFLNLMAGFQEEINLNVISFGDFSYSVKNELYGRWANRLDRLEREVETLRARLDPGREMFHDVYHFSLGSDFEQLAESLKKLEAGRLEPPKPGADTARSELRLAESLPLVTDFVNTLYRDGFSQAGPESVRPVVDLIRSVGTERFERAFNAAVDEVSRTHARVLAEQNRLLIRTLGKPSKRAEGSYTIGLVLPRDMDPAGAESLARNFLKGVSADAGIKAVAVAGKVPPSFSKRLKAMGKGLRPVNSLSRAIAVPGQAAVPTAVLEDKLSGAIHPAFLPFWVEMGDVKDTLVRDYTERLSAVALAHTARILEERPELAGRSAELRAELLKRLYLFEGFESIVTEGARGGRSGFVVSAAVAQAYLEHLTQQRIQQSA